MAAARQKPAHGDANAGGRGPHQVLRLSDIGPALEQGAALLDLGCGNGDLLSYLIASKQVRGSGVEISQAAVEACVARGMKPHLARLTLARKIAAITLLVWKKGVRFDAEHLKQQAA